MGLGCVELNEVYVTQDSSVEAMLDDCCSTAPASRLLKCGNDDNGGHQDWVYR